MEGGKQGMQTLVIGSGTRMEENMEFLVALFFSTRGLGHSAMEDGGHTNTECRAEFVILQVGAVGEAVWISQILAKDAGWGLGI